MNNENLDSNDPFSIKNLRYQLNELAAAAINKDDAGKPDIADEIAYERMLTMKKSRERINNDVDKNTSLSSAFSNNAPHNPSFINNDGYRGNNFNSYTGINMNTQETNQVYPDMKVNPSLLRNNKLENSIRDVVSFRITHSNFSLGLDNDNQIIIANSYDSSNAIISNYGITDLSIVINKLVSSKHNPKINRNKLRVLGVSNYYRSVDIADILAYKVSGARDNSYCSMITKYHNLLDVGIIITESNGIPIFIPRNDSNVNKRQEIGRMLDQNVNGVLVEKTITSATKENFNALLINMANDTSAADGTIASYFNKEAVARLQRENSIGNVNKDNSLSISIFYMISEGDLNIEKIQQTYFPSLDISILPVLGDFTNESIMNTIIGQDDLNYLYTYRYKDLKDPAVARVIDIERYTNIFNRYNSIAGLLKTIYSKTNEAIYSNIWGWNSYAVNTSNNEYNIFSNLSISNIETNKVKNDNFASVENTIRKFSYVKYTIIDLENRFDNLFMFAGNNLVEVSINRDRTVDTRSNLTIEYHNGAYNSSCTIVYFSDVINEYTSNLKGKIVDLSEKEKLELIIKKLEEYKIYTSHGRAYTPEAKKIEELDLEIFKLKREINELKNKNSDLNSKLSEENRKVEEETKKVELEMKTNQYKDSQEEKTEKVKAKVETEKYKTWNKVLEVIKAIGSVVVTGLTVYLAWSKLKGKAA